MPCISLYDSSRAPSMYDTVHFERQSESFAAFENFSSVFAAYVRKPAIVQLTSVGRRSIQGDAKLLAQSADNNLGLQSNCARFGTAGMRL